jgi:3-oxoadipate enol-lactonase
VTEQSKSETGFAAVNDTRLYYEAGGTGQALILIRGGLVDSRMWDAQFAVFAQHYRTVRYDLRGNGQSAMPSGDYTDYEDLFQLLQFLEIRQARLLGSSGGAALAIDFTLQHSELVAALTLVAPGVNGYTWSPTHSNWLKPLSHTGKRVQ